jgi:hypothetical protein
VKAALLVFAVFLILAGCGRADSWPKPRAEFFHAANSAQAIKRVGEMQRAGFVVAPVAFTGSMRPWLVGGELVVMEPYHGQPLAKGDPLVFNRDDGTLSVLHMVASVNERAVYMTGINNRYSDGWHPLSSVRYIVREVIDWPGSQLPRPL